MNTKQGINVLSLFDGISIAQLSLKKLKVPIANYYSSEIDKNAIKVAQHHFPETKQLGDVRILEGKSLPKIDLLTCGSPCQDLSSLRKDRKGLEGDKSSLFFHALRLLQETQPKYWLFENVASMSWTDRNRMDTLLGVEGVTINSNIISAQNRHRIYWTNIPFTIPDNKYIVLDDIIEDGYTDSIKGLCVLTKNISHTKKGLVRYITKSIGNIVYIDKSFSDLSKTEKLNRIHNMSDAEAKALFRLLYIGELEKLQTLPAGYVDDILKKTASTHAIGNGFTLEIIKHIFSSAKF